MQIFINELNSRTIHPEQSEHSRTFPNRPPNFDSKELEKIKHIYFLLDGKIALKFSAMFYG